VQVKSLQSDLHLSTPSASGLQPSLEWQSLSLMQSGTDGFSQDDNTGFHS
jgi:hypothetical protein